MNIFLSTRNATIRTAMDQRGSAAIEFALIAPLMFLLYVAAVEMSQAFSAARNVAELTHTLADLTSRQTTSPAYDTNGQLDSKPFISGPTAVPISTIDTIMNASAAILAPFPTTNLQMTLTAVDISNNPATGDCCAYSVRWTYQKGGGPLRGSKGPSSGCGTLSSDTYNSSTTVLSLLTPYLPTTGKPGINLVAYEAVIIADVKFSYSPVFGSLNLGALAGGQITFAPVMYNTQYVFPRSTGQIVLSEPVTKNITDGNGTGIVCY